MNTEPDFLNTAAKEHFGLDYLFPWQRLVISNILEGCGYFGSPGAENNSSEKDAPVDGTSSGDVPPQDTPRRQIAILPTGAGKSLCFMLPGVLLGGITLILFPLLSLLADQKRRLEEQGIAVELIAGGMSREDREAAWGHLVDGSSRFLLSNPETLIQPASLRRLTDLEIAHFVIDEAHTIPDWGEGFRPALLRIPEIIEAADPGMLSAFTATASDAILEGLQEIIFKEDLAHVIRANPDRPNITYHVVPILSKKRELRRLLGANREVSGISDPPGNTDPSAKNPLQLPRPTLIFCGSRNATEETAAFLRSALGEKEIFFYHAGLSREEKKKIEEWFFHSDTGILLATTAYGMGVDKGGIRTVLHLDISQSVEAFLQESGRGGRDGNPAYSVVLMPVDQAMGHGPDALGDIRVQAQSRSPEQKDTDRKNRLLRALADDHTCVREGLLRAMGSEIEFCSGCDVCLGSRPATAEGEREILHFFRYSRYRYRRNAAATLLRGRSQHTGSHAGSNTGPGSDTIRIEPAVPGAGSLATWTTKEIREAIGMLLKAGKLKKPRRGPWRGLIGTPWPTWFTEPLRASLPSWRTHTRA